MQHWDTTPESIAAAADALQKGKLVGMPTETVYGLAGNALDAEAVAAIFDVKARPQFDPLIVHTATAAEALDLASSVPEPARLLAERFWPGPLTLVLPRREGLPDLLSAGLETLALRVPSHPVAQALLQASELPLAAPSANRFGRISPTRAEHVMEELGDDPRVEGVLDAGDCEVGVESTVVGFPEPGRVVVYRLGATPMEAIREIIDDVEWVRAADAEDDPELAVKGEQSPGMLARHYAPRTPLTLLEEGARIPQNLMGQTGWLVFDRLLEEVKGPQEVLSTQRHLPEAAARLFACLRRLDGLGLDQIIAWKVPDRGLGCAINDRLTRAAFRS
jgi:L-threonylcarbamoyladenylate synthase